MKPKRPNPSERSKCTKTYATTRANKLAAISYPSTQRVLERHVEKTDLLEESATAVFTAIELTTK